MIMWLTLLAGSAVCYILKLTGYLVPDAILERPVVTRLVATIPVALLAALCAVMTFGVDQAVTMDARVAGLAGATVALVLRAPFLAVVATAAATAALIRLL